MRNILYICTKNQHDWNSFIPEPAPSLSEIDLSVLLLQNGLSLPDIPTSQVFVLGHEGERGEDSSPYEPISYQGFLEKIFLADLALVI
ncbi:hypothetical protein [uncultured Nitrospira sp.]|uniref:hypothetical protein n=1 Tax=uncultured Nitrospira sp. TaxID=157176 RepID=UPI0031400437